MRRLLTVAAALAVLPAAAQPTGLTAEQMGIYQSSRLQIETVTNTRYRADWRPYGYDLTDVSTTRWRGYVGDERVGEVAFYRYAGADDLADYVAGRRQRGWIAVGLGVAAIGAGVAVIATAPDGADNRFTDRQLTGLGVSLLGASTAALGAVVLSRNHTSVRQAVGAAERFNGSLEETLRRRLPADG